MLLAGLAPLWAVEDNLPRGSSYLHFTLRGLSADEYLDQNEIRVPTQYQTADADYEDQYAELTYARGWTPDITLLAKTIYRRRELDGANGNISQSGVSGVYLATRQRLSRLGSASRLTAETGVWLPAQADRDNALPLESGNIDWVMTMSYAQDFFPTDGGFEMDFGYRFRNGDPDDELFFDTRLHIDARRLFKVSLGYHVVESTDDNLTEYPQTDYPNERGFQGAEVEFSKLLSSRWQVTLGYEQVLKGRNVFRGEGWRLGMRRYF